MNFILPGLLFASVALGKASVELTGDNFQSITHIGDNTTDIAEPTSWFIKFYAPWCGHCKRLAPTWEELAGVVPSNVHIGSVDSTEERGLAKRFGIRGFPTLLYFTDNQVIKYKGSRKLDNLEAFVNGGWREAEANDVPAAENAEKSLRQQSHHGWFW